jgi:exonuclease VII large subunit
MSEQTKRDLEQERQRIAEQAKRELDEAKRQLAEARKQADDAAAQVDRAKKQAAADAQQQIEAVKRETARQAEQAAQQAKVAALAPPAASPSAQVPPLPNMDPADVTRLLQAHLKRVGCDPGVTDGNWNAGSQKALDGFNKYAGTKLDIKVASLDALDAVRSQPDRVCPLVCGKREKATVDRCTQIVCESNLVLDSEGICRRRPDPPQKPMAASRHERKATRPSASGGGRDSCYGDCEGD